MSNKVEELLSAAKIGDLLHRQEKTEKSHKWVKVLAIIGGVTAIAAIAYGIYRFFAPDYLDDFEDDLDDDFFEEEELDDEPEA